MAKKPSSGGKASGGKASTTLDNFSRLEQEGLVSSGTLNQKVVDRINSVDPRDLDALIRVYKKVGTLGVFFDGVKPQM